MLLLEGYQQYLICMALGNENRDKKKKKKKVPNSFGPVENCNSSDNNS